MKNLIKNSRHFAVLVIIFISPQTSSHLNAQQCRCKKKDNGDWIYDNIMRKSLCDLLIETRLKESIESSKMKFTEDHKKKRKRWPLITGLLESFFLGTTAHTEEKPEISINKSNKLLAKAESQISKYYSASITPDRAAKDSDIGFVEHEFLKRELNLEKECLLKVVNTIRKSNDNISIVNEQLIVNQLKILQSERDKLKLDHQSLERTIQLLNSQIATLRLQKEKLEKDLTVLRENTINEKRIKELQDKLSLLDIELAQKKEQLDIELERNKNFKENLDYFKNEIGRLDALKNEKELQKKQLHEEIMAKKKELENVAERLDSLKRLELNQVNNSINMVKRDSLRKEIGILNDEISGLKTMLEKYRRKQGVRIVVLKIDTIYFEVGQHTIGAQGTKKLNTLINIYKNCIDCKFRISGHADEIGLTKNNTEFHIKLSRNRAFEVEQYLQNRLPPIVEIHSKGYGPLGGFNKRMVIVKVLGYRA